MTPTPAPARRIPSLDGIRAISIGLVLASHIIHAFGLPTLSRYTIGIVNFGNLGVRIFFVISGFLITSLLLAEQSARGTISLPHFYLRRTLRIFPPYYVLLLSVALATNGGWLLLHRGDLLHAVTYTMNYQPDRAWSLGHTWSLAVEEQFYLIWPALLLVLGVRRGLWLAAGLVLLAPVTRIVLLAGTPATFVLHRTVGTSFETVGDAIAVGCLLAGLRTWLWQASSYRRLIESPAFILVPLLVVLLAAMPETAMTFWTGASRNGALALYQTAGLLLINVGIGMTIDWSVRNGEGRVGRWLNAPIPVWLGTISYSLYLWQQVLLNPELSVPVAWVPLNLLLVVFAATISYYAIERPSLRMRSRIERCWFAREDC